MDLDIKKLNIKQMKSQSKNTKLRQNIRNKRRGLNSQGRLVNTQEYAIAWGVLNKPYSVMDLKKKCREDKESPSYYFITKHWKGYPLYYKTLVKHGMQPRPPRTDKQRRKMIDKSSKNGFKKGLLDKDYDIARIAASYGVTCQSSYNKIRKQKPDAKLFLPSLMTIVHIFGSWRRFMYQVMKYNVDLVLTQYVKISSETGHWLKLSQCDKLKIPIRGIMNILRPKLFNALCYKKLSLMEKDLNNKKGKE